MMTTAPHPGQLPSQQPLVLCIDDDPVVQILLSDVVEKAGAEYRPATTAREAEQLLINQSFDLILLDRRLPDSEGLLLIETIRQNSKCPIIILSEMSSASDRLLGLGLGATEYISKPFSPSELTSRIRFMLLDRRRRQVQEKSRPVILNHLHFDPVTRQLKLDDKESFLPVSEARLLHAFLLHAGEVLNRDYLSVQTCHREWEPGDRTIDVLVSRLRRRLPENIVKITTVHRSGYILTLPD